jgi:hypothetical protein
MRLQIRNDYPEAWPVVARAAKDEAGWRCVRCRHPFLAGVGTQLPCAADCDPTRCHRRKYGKTLNYGVHHLDGDKANGAWWNLLPLCNACHLSVQARVIPERAWLLDHSDWFLPYVCGWYAHFYGNMAITRAEAEAHPSWYLALGQPWRDAGPQPARLPGGAA